MKTNERLIEIYEEIYKEFEHTGIDEDYISAIITSTIEKLEKLTNK